MAIPNDRSRGYESVAEQFQGHRHASSVGLSTIRDLGTQLPAGASVLDLGCGTGVPVTRELVRLGFSVAGIDASPTLIAEFHRRFPEALWACEAVEDSTLFGKQFDAIVAIGLMFLLPEEVQRTVILKVGAALVPAGRFLFTAPHQNCEWRDVLTGQRSVSLGTPQYEAALLHAGLAIVGNPVDDGENYYFDCQKKHAGVHVTSTADEVRA